MSAFDGLLPLPFGAELVHPGDDATIRSERWPFYFPAVPRVLQIAGGAAWELHGLWVWKHQLFNYEQPHLIGGDGLVWELPRGFALSVPPLQTSADCSIRVTNTEGRSIAFRGTLWLAPVEDAR